MFYVSVYHNSAWAGLGSNQRLCGKRSATKLLSYSTTKNIQQYKN